MEENNISVNEATPVFDPFKKISAPAPAEMPMSAETFAPVQTEGSTEETGINETSVAPAQAAVSAEENSGAQQTQEYSAEPVNQAPRGDNNLENSTPPVTENPAPPMCGYGSYGMMGAAVPPPPPSTPTAPTTEKKTQNGMAIAAMVIGILSITLGFANGTGVILGILGIIFARVSRNKETRKMDGMAKAGLICGICGIVQAVLMFLLIIVIYAVIIAVIMFSEGMGSAPTDEFYQVVSRLAMLF